MSDAGMEQMSQPEQSINIVKPIESSKSQEIEKNTLDALLVFGQGPVIEKDTKRKAGDIAKGQGSEDINLWSKTLAQAAVELYKRGQTREIIVMGGKTGGQEYGSEAELIAETIESLGVPSQVIKREDRSTNTLENLVNVLNDYLDKDQQGKNLGILTANYHLSRTGMLMKLFDIPYKNSFSAEEVMRYVAREGGDWEKWDQNQLSETEKKLDMGTKGNQYFEQKLGEEKRTVTRRGQQEDVWSRALLEVPEYWLGYIGRINNPERIRQILTNQDQAMLKDRFGIDLTSDNDESLKTKLLLIKRNVPSLEDWIAQDWPGEIKTKLEKFVEKRQ